MNYVKFPATSVRLTGLAAIIVTRPLRVNTNFSFDAICRYEFFTILFIIAVSRKIFIFLRASSTLHCGVFGAWRHLVFYLSVKDFIFFLFLFDK